MDVATFNLLTNFLNSCDNVDLPYFVLSTKDVLSGRLCTAFSIQLFRNYLPLYTAFSGENPRVARQEHAIQLFQAAVPAQRIRHDVNFFFVRAEPHPNTDILRFPLTQTYNFLTALRNLPAAQASAAVRAAFEHVPHCQVDYENRIFDIPPPPQALLRRPTMAHFTINPVLPVFSGSDPEEDINLFFARLNRIFDCYDDMTPAHYLVHLENQCRGPALSLFHAELQWLEQNPRAPGANDDRTPLQRYNHIRDKLIETFAVNRDTELYREQLQSRCKLDSESFQTYMENVLSLCRRAGIVEQAEILKHLHKGLPYAIALVLKPDDLTLANFLERVQRIDQIHRASMRTRSLKAMESCYNSTTASPFVSDLPNIFKPPSIVKQEAVTAPVPPKAEQNPATASLVIDNLINKLQNLIIQNKPATVSAVSSDAPLNSAARRGNFSPYQSPQRSPRNDRRDQSYRRDCGDRRSDSRPSRRDYDDRRSDFRPPRRNYDERRPDFRPPRSFNREEGFSRGPSPRFSDNRPMNSDYRNDRRSYRRDYDNRPSPRYSSTNGDPSIYRSNSRCSLGAPPPDPRMCGARAEVFSVSPW
ncbi:uncharacterized protein LOC117651927 [Thrips palmi]|uniref:Uncharacterized protein LOC117651927 n=1 Tax=Thrips palmi TaxID=161013 RepID=A0A6P9A7X5_THRPL|nr:uncharacterized protein LOC117651927 [Thrips palmi]